MKSLVPYKGLISNAGKARTMFIVNSDISGKHIAAEAKYLKPADKTLQRSHYSLDYTNQLVANEQAQLAKDNAFKGDKMKCSFSFISQSREGAYDSIVGPKQYRREKVPPQGHYMVSYGIVDR
jgi:hypothetical protein